jgi:hypothetical protein
MAGSAYCSLDVCSRGLAPDQIPSVPRERRGWGLGADDIHIASQLRTSRIRLPVVVARNRRILCALFMTNRDDLDALVDGMEPDYADASTSIGQARVVAAAALNCAFQLADALDALTQQVADIDAAQSQQMVNLMTEVSDLRRHVEQLADATRRGNR